MNDLFYIKYNPELMLSDSLDMDAVTELAHRRLCDFIWRLDCAPKMDVKKLISFCKCEPSQWGRVLAGLKEKGWHEKGGFLLHIGAINSHNTSKEEYCDSCNQTEAANAKRAGREPRYKVCVRDSITGLVTMNVTTDVTMNVTPLVTMPQLELKPEPELKHTYSEGARDETFEKLKTRLHELYRRKAGEQWSYQEEHALAEIARRTESWAELEHILKFRGTMHVDERKRYFPQSLYSLLSKWNETLDKARVQCPLPKVKPPVVVAAKKAVPESEKASSAMLRESIKHLESVNPKSPMLTRFREQLKELETK